MPIITPAMPPPILPTGAQSSVAATTTSSAVPPTATEPSPSRFPIVRLDVDFISDDIASLLATSLLGHVLFLKNQVPFPVAQLSRIPSSKSSARTIKQRTDLLVSFDTLSSHLLTTFTALSTAFARCGAGIEGASTAHKTLEPTLNESEKEGNHKTARAYLAILVGPGIGSARTKVLLGIDGLEAKVWGMRDDLAPSENEIEDEDEGEEDSGSEPEDSESEDDDDNEDVEDHSDEEEEEGLDDIDDESDEEAERASQQQAHARTKQALHTADRLLARALAAASSEEGGGGIDASELAPTQTHVLIRAPRRFTHPAWVPQQGVTRAMEGVLEEFLNSSSAATPLPKPTPAKKKAKNTKVVEGVWVTTSASDDIVYERKGEVAGQEEDEMIWWSWDGRILGFEGW